MHGFARAKELRDAANVDGAPIGGRAALL